MVGSPVIITRCGAKIDSGAYPDRLLNNPWACPPLPSDWEVQPTYSRHTVPYYLAPLWDANVAVKAMDERRKGQGINKRPTAEQQIPKELRGKLKKARAAKGLLQDLEEQVRRFVKSWDEKMKKVQHDGADLIDSEDEEIVFVGRNGQMNDMPPSPNSRRGRGNELPQDQLQVFDSLATDQGANFGYVCRFSMNRLSADPSLDAGLCTILQHTMGFELGRSL